MPKTIYDQLNPKASAMVVLSGGQDSTTCLYWIKEYLSRFEDTELHAVTFDYGQRHYREIESARRIALLAGVDSHEIISVGSILKGTSPLVDSSAELEQYKDHASLPGGLEKTFVPMRNQLFMTIAANRAFVKGCSMLVTGVCEEDFGGYPDCRSGFLDALCEACNLGTFTGLPSDSVTGSPGPLSIVAPLLSMSKAESVLEALHLPGCYEALAWSHTGYDGVYPPDGRDHATLLRAKGFEEAGVPDPLVLRAHMGGLMELPSTRAYDMSKRGPLGFMRRIAKELHDAAELGWS